MSKPLTGAAAKARSWTDAEDLFILDNWHEGLDWLAENMNRSKISIGTRHSRLGSDLSFPYSIRRRAQAQPRAPRANQLNKG